MAKNKPMVNPGFYCQKYIECHNHLPQYQPKGCQTQCHGCMDVIIDHHFNQNKVNNGKSDDLHK